jgi:hypothetical protein
MNIEFTKEHIGVIQEKINIIKKQIEEIQIELDMITEKDQ